MRQTVGRDTEKASAKSLTEWSPVSYMRRSSRDWRSDSLDCLPRSLPLALPDDRRAEARRRFNILRPHLIDGVPLTKVDRVSEVSVCILQRRAARYHRDGFVGLARAPRSDAGRRSLPPELVALIEGLTLHKPKLSAAAIHRRIMPIANARDWPVPSCATVHAIVDAFDPGLVTLAHVPTRPVSW